MAYAICNYCGLVFVPGSNVLLNDDSCPSCALASTRSDLEEVRRQVARLVIAKEWAESELARIRDEWPAEYERQYDALADRLDVAERERDGANSEIVSLRAAASRQYATQKEMRDVHDADLAAAIARAEAAELALVNDTAVKSLAECLESRARFKERAEAAKRSADQFEQDWRAAERQRDALLEALERIAIGLEDESKYEPAAGEFAAECRAAIESVRGRNG